MSLTKLSKIVLIFLIFSSSLTQIFISNNNLSFFEALGSDNRYIVDYDFDSSPSNSLYLVYNERQLDKSKLKLITSDSDYKWNFTAEIIIEENNSLLLKSSPSLITGSESFWIISSFSKNGNNGLILLMRNYNETTWHNSIPILENSLTILEPNLKIDQNNKTIWLCWKDNRNSSFNYNYMIYNITTGQWDNNIKTINSINGFNCSSNDFVIDNSGNAHFIWSQGAEYSNQIFYRCIFGNGTLGSIEIITDGTTNCINPLIIIDAHDYLNIFWENRTVPHPDFYGTINIQSSRKEFNGTWSFPIEVAPYIPPDRSPSGESDALEPAITIDKSNDLWLAYRIREDYAYRQGIDIRKRDNLIWDPSSQVSLINSLAIHPKLNCDYRGNLHCMWLDLRSGYYQLYYRSKSTNNVWSDTILLTKTVNSSGDILKYILIIIGAIAVFTIPTAFLNFYLKRRTEKKLKKKLDLLNE